MKKGSQVSNSNLCVTVNRLVLNIFLNFLTPFWTVFQSFLEIFSTHPQHFQIWIAIASQSCNFMLVSYLSRGKLKSLNPGRPVLEGHNFNCWVAKSLNNFYKQICCFLLLPFKEYPSVVATASLSFIDNNLSNINLCDILTTLQQNLSMPGWDNWPQTLVIKTIFGKV